jgi:hypothetical protein
MRQHGKGLSNMIIARATNKEGEVLILGLSRRNLERLLADQPIVIRRKTHGDGIPDGWTITIFTGEDEDAMYRELERTGVFSAKTKIIRDPRLGSGSGT